MTADPDEGIAPDGTIRTGVARGRVPAAYEPVLADVVAAVPAGVSVHLYGSVATGRAVPPTSDVDILTVGLPAATASALADRLSRHHAPLCRGVAIGAASADDLTGDGDEAYGLRVFLRHHCVHLAGPDPAATFPAVQADARAVRGFNGDIDRHRRAWLAAVHGSASADGAEVAALATRVARKTLLAIAGLVSLRDETWTTDRTGAAVRWATLEPADAAAVRELVEWLTVPSTDPAAVAGAIDGIVARVVERFAAHPGLWRGVSVDPDPGAGT